MTAGLRKSGKDIAGFAQSLILATNSRPLIQSTMTEKDHSRFRSSDSSGDELGRSGFKGDSQEDGEISGLKRTLEEHLKDLDSFKQPRSLRRTVAEAVDEAISIAGEADGRDNFDRLLREGSKASRAKNASQSNGCISLLLIFSFLISLAFPLFWVVFVLILLVVLASSGREWMG